jgi:hypothetical protein
VGALLEADSLLGALLKEGIALGEAITPVLVGAGNPPSSPSSSPWHWVARNAKRVRRSGWKTFMILECE